MRTPIKWVAWLFLWLALCMGTRAAASPRQEPHWSSRAFPGCHFFKHSYPLCKLLESQRRVVDEGVAEYSYTLQVGVGRHDVITVHRVVEEVLPGLPRLASRAVFLVHGDIWGFRGAFLASLTSSAVPRGKSLALYLARQGLDVWGIDLRWVHVPPYTEDFTFMKNWNLEMHVQDVRIAMQVARTVRALGLKSSGAMPLLGWSRGATIGYALLNLETNLPLEERQVSAFVPVDMAYSLGADSHAAASTCQAYQALALRYTEGMYVDVNGQVLQDLGAFANAAPSLPSPLLQGLTNRQAALVAGAATYRLQPEPLFGWYHFTGGPFENFMPMTTAWTQERFLFDTMEQASSFQSIGEQLETLAMWCGAPKLPYNDRLRLVTVPVFYVGAAGGMGRLGLSTLLQLGSKDLSAYIVQRMSDQDQQMDYGHADLLLASDADTEVWPRIADWFARH
ncbi:MAG: hypothetical protein ABW123_25650 [Cystobacter sp.]